MTALRTLANRLIVIGVTGSIAAVETVKLIHELRRKGAEVQPVMSPAAAGIISPDTLTYASGRQAITRLTGLVEHVMYCGDGGSADLFIIAPCTANTLSKIACGIDDTPVTTFATTALGSGKPVLVVPAMHYSMYRHPALTGNMEKIQTFGIVIVKPLIEEGKAKIASSDEIVLHCERALLGWPLKGKKVLITSGPCREYVDDIRVLTTRSSGEIGRSLALHAFRLGADVTVVHRDIFPCVKNVFAESAGQMREAVLHSFSISNYDFYISAAAISDFAPEKVEGKIPSGKKTAIQLKPLGKLLDEVMERYSTFTIAFKLGRDEQKKAQRMIDRGVGIVLVNTPETMGSITGDYVMLTPAGISFLGGTKDTIAAAVWEEAVLRLPAQTYN